MAWNGHCTVLSVAIVLMAASSVSGSSAPAPMDVSGVYTESELSRCHCWNPERNCDCVTDGCSYAARIGLSVPSDKGLLTLKMFGDNATCNKGSEGPFPAYVDQCGRLIAGANWESSSRRQGFHHNLSYFDPSALDQSMDLVVVGNVLGFNGGPAGYRHTAIMRRNITICDTREFLDGNCTPGQERFVCWDKFSFCTDGNCAYKNKMKVSPKGAAFVSRLSNTAFNGTYDLDPKSSSSTCPPSISAFHYGTHMGLGYSQSDTFATTIVDNSYASETASCIQFAPVCHGLDFHFKEGWAGHLHKENGYMIMTAYQITAEEGNDLLDLKRCVFKSRAKAPTLILPYDHEHGAVVALSVTLSLCIVGILLVAFCCLTYRRKFIESKIDRAYDVFQS